MFETWHKMIAMLQSGLDVRKVITHRLPAADFLVRLRDDAARRLRQDRARLVERRRRRLRGGEIVAAIRIRPLTIDDAAAAASLVRQAFAAQSRATDPPSGALGETTASVAAKLAAGGGAGAEIDGALAGVVLWAEKKARSISAGNRPRRASAAPGNRRRVAGGGRGRGAPPRHPAMTLRVRLALDENQRLFAGFGFAPVGQGAHRGFRERTLLVMESG